MVSGQTICFRYSGESLSLTGTEIPSEPMYLLMNTAVATTWGFPLPCPDGCDCDCYECGNPDCSCGFPQGFCSNVPAHFEIEHVRVWQAKNESKHVLGCSTEDRPTAHFIEGNKKNFMESGDREPLKQLQNGGGLCHKDSQCGGTERESAPPPAIPLPNVSATKNSLGRCVWLIKVFMTTPTFLNSRA